MQRVGVVTGVTLAARATLSRHREESKQECLTERGKEFQLLGQIVGQTDGQ